MFHVKHSFVKRAAKRTAERAAKTGGCHGEETSDGQRGVRACGFGGGGARGRGLSGHAVLRAHRDGGEAPCQGGRSRGARGVVDQREERARAVGGRVLYRRALLVHLQASRPQRGQRCAHELELRGREGRHGAVRCRRSGSHLIADRAGYAPLRGFREAARAGPVHAGRRLRHDAGRVRPVRALPHARHRASHHAHQPCLDVLRRGRCHRGAPGAGGRLRARFEMGHFPAPRLPGAWRDQRAAAADRARLRA